MPLYDVAREAGLTTAAFLWPVTAGSKINYNLAEIFPNRIWTNQVLVSLKASSPLFLYQMNHRYGKLRRVLQVHKRVGPTAVHPKDVHIEKPFHQRFCLLNCSNNDKNSGKAISFQHNEWRTCIAAVLGLPFRAVRILSKEDERKAQWATKSSKRLPTR